MRYGTPYSCGYGDPNNHFLYAIPDAEEMVARGYRSIPYRLMLRSGKNSGFAQIYRNASLYRVLPITQGEELALDVPLPWGSNTISLMALYVGQLGTFHDCSAAVRVEETLDNKNVTLRLNFPYEAIGAGTYTSSWTLTGAEQGVNTALVNDHPTWGRLRWVLTVDTGIATVELYVGVRLVASGSGAVATTITLTAQNDSGLAGSVAVAGGAADETGDLDVRWVKALKIKRGTTNPPMMVVATVPFSGKNDDRWTELDELEEDTTYYYRTTLVTDANVDGSSSSVTSVTTTSTPNPPDSVAYSSGNAANLTLAISTVPTGEAYRLYLATVVGEVVNLQDIKATAAAGASTINYAGGITGYPGKVYGLLRAYRISSGEEEKNGNLFELEFDAAGNFVEPRPNDAAVVTITPTGLDIDVAGIYDPTKEKGTATQLKLFTRTDAGSYNFAAPADTVALSAGFNGYKTAALTATLGGAGYYWVTIKAATAGGTLSESYTEQRIYVSTGTMSAPTLSAELSRS